MNGLFVNKVIGSYGGKKWLENTSPTTLFNILKGEYRGTADIRTMDLNKYYGWLFSVEKIGLGRMQVNGYFYKKGKWPMTFSGKFLYLKKSGWRYINDIPMEFAPSAEDFVSQVLNLVKGE